ncbi:hypothetical protein SCLCIDRAFT_1223747 [Scleroderma citrinum Foug A]|uniref:Uncharacterized protein n=1 Tax=Scleroderma citrinum Foug A TaxID=1036808 RepID=A0A0C2ZI53_9AGAM|nr:hypothetical protein SCLCIDRAFT_1223747 [Scleroderma citrinum Foug A]
MNPLSCIVRYLRSPASYAESINSFTNYQQLKIKGRGVISQSIRSTGPTAISHILRHVFEVLENVQHSPSVSGQ